MLILTIIPVTIWVVGIILWNMQVLQIAAILMLPVSVLNLVRIFYEWRKKKKVERNDLED